MARYSLPLFASFIVTLCAVFQPSHTYQIGRWERDRETERQTEQKGVSHLIQTCSSTGTNCHPTLASSRVPANRTKMRKTKKRPETKKLNTLPAAQNDERKPCVPRHYQICHEGLGVRVPTVQDQTQTLKEDIEQTALSGFARTSSSVLEQHTPLPNLASSPFPSESFPVPLPACECNDDVGE
ncbi:hypothetical protein BDP81DRAFT_5287 [Colletotrichum phormii]|uniref:Secreted protein n=1 Tax=Colletotrichum phormii TaxID=359342 RepID=A0AAJ0A5Q1_9PEZI|nr:uncharacterized protein BDP81DRAFT_5287 [Colletotrichum phormii]KAK1655507.1 hypothetical protein BDP81DRAFT_5287 [Colletotrichum phormii]